MQKAWCLLHPHLYSTPALAAPGPCSTALVGISQQQPTLTEGLPCSEPRSQNWSSPLLCTHVREPIHT